MPSNSNQAKSIKTVLRKKMRQRRRSLNPHQQKQAALKLCKHLGQHGSFLNSQRIALYLANDGEVSTQPLIELAWRMGKQVYLPVLHPVLKNRMWFVNYTKHSKMQKNIFKINEPNPKFNHRVPARTLGMVGLPLVAFDIKGGRLGMGGGFYDRTLATWYEQSEQLKHTKQEHKDNSKINLYPIGIAHQCQQVNKVPIEAWDIPLSEIITPLKVFKLSD